MMRLNAKELWKLEARFISNHTSVNNPFSNRTATSIPANAQSSSGKKEMIIGPLRVLPGRLSVSRTFGDIEAKIEKRGGNRNVIIAVPEIKSFRIVDDHDFIVLASKNIYGFIMGECR